MRRRLLLPMTVGEDARIMGDIEVPNHRGRQIGKAPAAPPRVDGHLVPARPARQRSVLVCHVSDKLYHSAESPPGSAEYVISHCLRRSCMLRRSRTVAVIVLSVAAAATVGAQNKPSAGDRLDTLKTEVAAKVDARAKLAQEMVDSVFSFGELGFQEFEIGRAHVSTPVTVKSRM